MIKKIRDKIKGIEIRRSFRYGSNWGLLILIVLGILVIIGLISERYHLTFDLTSQRIHTISPQSKKILAAISVPVKAIAFYQTDQPGKGGMEDLLKQYEYNSKTFTYTFIDPDKDPALAKKYKVSNYGTVVIEKNGRFEGLDEPDEEMVTNSLYRLTRTTKKVIYFLKGHGEKDPWDGGRTGYSTVRERLESKDYEVRELLLLREKEVPKDCSLLIIAGPQKDPFPLEMDSITRYIERGGNFFFLIEPDTVPSFKGLLGKYNVALGDDIIVDAQSKVLWGDFFTAIVSNYIPHQITEDFGMATIMPTARSVDIKEERKIGYLSQPIAATSEGSYGETDFESVNKKKMRFDQNKDKKGPVPVAIVEDLILQQIREAEKKGVAPQEKKGEVERGPETRIGVIGDSDFATNTYIGLSGNRDFFLNVANWLAGASELVAIPPKKGEKTEVVLSNAQRRTIFFSSAIGLPFAILIVGAVIFWYRRFRA